MYAEGCDAANWLVNLFFCVIWGMLWMLMKKMPIGVVVFFRTLLVFSHFFIVYLPTEQ